MDEGKYVDVRVRFGFGGFRDSRSPEDGLGGEQGAVDIKPAKLPLILTYSTERYTNSKDPTNNYEIASMHSVSLFYLYRLPAFNRVSYTLGGGAGRVKVPVGEQSPNARFKGDVYSLEVGINMEIWKGLGAYGLVKYLKAEKSIDSERVIDFKETILLVGVSYRFGL